MTIRITLCCVVALACPAPVVGQPASTAAGEHLTLAAAIRIAIDNNRQVLSARLQVDKADAEVASARSRRLPVFETEWRASQLVSPVDFTFPQGAFGDFPGTGPIPATDTAITVPRQPTYYASSQVSQPLSQLFRIGLGIQSATTASEIERERARAKEQSVVNGVKRLYFAILQTASELTANEEAIRLYRELDKTMQARVAQQVVLRSEALDVQFRLAQEELARTTRHNRLASQKEQLNQLLGRDPNTAFDVADVTDIPIADVDPKAAHARALDNRPDVREARLTLRQADLDRRMAKADRIPDISVGFSYVSNFHIDVLPANFASVGVEVKWEPFDWGRRNHEVAVKTHAVQQARLSARDVEDRVVVEINSRLRTLAEKRAFLNVARMAQATARERLRVKTDQYQVQAALLHDVLQVRAQLADMNDRYQQALLDFWTAKADYDLAVGEEGLQ
jgi:outer membrane protein